MNARATFLLFDGVLRKDLLPWIYEQEEALEIVPLYLGTRWEELKDIGPVLVQLQDTAGLLAAYESQTELHSVCSMLTSTQPIEILSAHLQQFIQVTDTLGSNSLLRYADPLVLQHWLGSYSPQALAWILGPVDEWRVVAQQPRWQSKAEPVWQRFSSAHTPRVKLGGNPNHLEEPQISALEQAYDQRFQERLDSWIEDTYPAFRSARLHNWGSWLGDQLYAAREWGLTTERSIATWIDLCIRFGDATLTDTDCLYTKWLKASQGAISAHPDNRIQAFDAYLSRHQKEIV